jgi:hypothetical protein
MGQYAQMITAPAKMARGYAERVLVGVTPQQFGRKPAAEGKTIETNHPAWVFGHLATYPAKIAPMVGLDGSKLAPPPNFEELFKDGTPCKDDPTGTIYPAMEAITGAFFRAHDGLFELLGGIDDAKLIQPTLDEKARQRFPLVGARVLFMCNNHIMMHMGQISAWRRCMGLPPA